MRTLLFTECVDLVGSTCKPFDGTKKYISTGAVDSDHINEADTEMIEYESKPSRANLVAEIGDVLFAKMQGTKKTLLVDQVLAGYIYSTGFCAVRAKKEVLTDRCLYHLLTSETFLKQKDRYCSGATQKAITNIGLSKIAIKVPKTEEQEKIVSQLDLIKGIFVKRQQELAMLDDLIKVRFVEMFGTLETPSQVYRMSTLKKLCYKITDGKHGGCLQKDGSGRYFVGAREIYDDAIHYDTAPEIDIAEFEKDYNRCNVEIGDFLIVNTGATIGKSAIATDTRTEHTLLQKSVALLKVKHDLIHPVFLKYCYAVNETMYRVDSASAQPNLLLSKISATEIYVPPMTQQEEFVAFVAQVNKSKVIVQKALDEAKLLLDSLMQKYFG